MSRRDRLSRLQARIETAAAVLSWLSIAITILGPVLDLLDPPQAPLEPAEPEPAGEDEPPAGDDLAESWLDATDAPAVELDRGNPA